MRLIDKIKYFFKPMLVGANGLCLCNCAEKCPLGKVANEPRCHVYDLNQAGIRYKYKIYLGYD